MVMESIGPCDLIIRDATLLLPETRTGILCDGAIAIRDGKIISTGTTAQVGRQFRARRNIDARGGVVHAGFIEPHFHIGQYVSRGIHHSLRSARRTDINYAAWKAAITAAEEHASIAHACLDLLKAGYTGFVDPGTVFSTAGAASAASAVGLRCWLTHPYLWDRCDNEIGGLVSDALLERVPADLERCRSALCSDIDLGSRPGLGGRHIGIYGESTASDTLWTEALQTARRSRLTLSAHLGFSPDLSRAFQSRHGCSQVAYLDRLGVLGPHLTLTHLNTLDDADMALLLERGCRAIWCPANARRAEIAGGHNRLVEFANAGGTVGVAIDVPQIHAIGEIGSIARMAAVDDHALTPRMLFAMMTQQAAATIGAGDRLGRLAEGSAADIVIRYPGGSEMMPGIDIYNELTCFGRASGVRSVVIAGELVFNDGVSTLVDEMRITRRGREAGQAIMRRLGLSDDRDRSERVSR